MGIATLTPNRGNDRAQFYEFCQKQIKEFEPYANTQVFVDYEPFSHKFDLIKRVRTGIEQIKAFRDDNVVMIESDDFYCKDYLSHFDFDNYDFIGWNNTTYYNIRTRQWQTTYHDHSSLCSTGFKISALNGFHWPPDDNLWLDIALWKFARQSGARIKMFRGEDGFMNPVLGIKHGIGRYGGKGHTLELANKDPNLEYLKSRVSEDAFEFYSNFNF